MFLPRISVRILASKHWVSSLCQSISRSGLQAKAAKDRWRERQLELGLNTVEKYEHVIQGFSRRAYVVSKRECCKELGHSGGELIVVGKNLALFTKSSLENVDLQRSFAYFHVLIPYHTANYSVKRVSLTKRSTNSSRPLLRSESVTGRRFWTPFHGTSTDC